MKATKTDIEAVQSMLAQAAPPRSIYAPRHVIDFLRARQGLRPLAFCAVCEADPCQCEATD